VTFFGKEEKIIIFEIKLKDKKIIFGLKFNEGVENVSWLLHLHSNPAEESGKKLSETR
jgi:hypothetical protein